MMGSGSVSCDLCCCELSTAMLEAQCAHTHTHTHTHALTPCAIRSLIELTRWKRPSLF